MSSMYTFTRNAFQQLQTAKLAAQQPVAIAPPPTMEPASLQPAPVAPPPIPGQLQGPSSAALYPTYSPAITDFASAPNVQAAAISADPTALTQDNLSPEAQSQNRANLLKVVGVAALIWLILSATGR